MEVRDRIILFDGVCNLCQRSVQWVIRHDPEAMFSFASLQSEVARQYTEGKPLPDSIVLIEQGQVFTESDAALRIGRSLRGWRWAGVFLTVPRPIRNAVYRLIARNRYRWWGKQESCWLPTPDLKRRFLD